MSFLGGLAKIALPVVGGAIGSIIPGVGTTIGAALGGAASGLIGGGGVKGAVTGAAIGGLGAGALGDAGGGITGILKGVGSSLLSNPGAVLGAGATLLGAQQASKAGDLQNQALDLAKQQYSDAAPFRTAGLAALNNLSANGGHDLSWMTAGSNPYAATFGGGSGPAAHVGTAKNVAPANIPSPVGRALIPGRGAMTQLVA